MRVAIDARELQGQPTGVGRFLSELLRAWSQLPAVAAHEFVLCSPEPIDLSGYPLPHIRSATRPGDGTAWEQLELPALLRSVDADVLFAPGYSAPLRAPVPTVVAIYDVSFCAHPEWFSWREGARRRTLTRLAAARASRVLTISRFSQREIVAHLGIDGAKVAVIYPGVPGVAATAGSPGTVSAAPQETSGDASNDASAGNMVLFVGSIFQRRHVDALIRACATIACTNEPVTLEIVGDNRTSPPLDLTAIAGRAGIADRVRVRSYVDDEELGRLYRRARAFVFLSEYEGFGFTPLEAMLAGVPPIVLDTAVAREVCGDAALFVSQPQPTLVAAALQRALLDGSERNRLLAAAPTVLARYSWARCAEGVLGLLLAAAGPATPAPAGAPPGPPIA